MLKRKVVYVAKKQGFLFAFKVLEVNLEIDSNDETYLIEMIPAKKKHGLTRSEIGRFEMFREATTEEVNQLK